MASAPSAGSGRRAVDHAGMRVLSDDECATMLASRQVGRLAFAADGQIEIFPVAFVLDGSAVVLRSGFGMKLLAALDRTVVAFEVDRFEPASRTGWSVVVKGTCEEIEDTGTLARLETTGFENWIEYPHYSSTYRWLRIRPYSVTGRTLPPRAI
ncbi:MULTISPECIES: pyridoxamine 5'-phosphate oxidase family protein [unclassified Frankia]|uniref:pyridoxamine 5'-phosphate oxidase family protein n=1 Tax=unclassified Frankia TaxID=2632575 RepID=UPI0027DC671E|nr:MULTISPECIES: pyridoxamine 5'-phosphate oxidase family protein [unclassified Frankia]